MSADSEVKPVSRPMPTPLTIPPFTVERMAVSDVPEVGAIERQSFPLAWPERAYRYEINENDKAHFFVVRALGVSELSTQNHETPNWINRLLRRAFAERPSDDHKVAPIVGYSGLWLMVDEAHIATIASHPEWRGRGIGELLLLNMLRVAQQLNAINTTLEVRVSNTAAQNLYHKYGFVEVGRRKAYYQDNREDALIMTVTTFQTQAYAEQLDHLESQLRQRFASLAA